MSDEGLLWNEKAGVGFYKVRCEGQYDLAYWQKYQGYAKTETGLALNTKRASLVGRHSAGAAVVDIGIGAGQFIEVMGKNAYGYDVNPIAIRWLLDRNLWWDPYNKDPDIACFWDSLEHIERPKQILSRVRRAAIISLPIFQNYQHVLRSKHFRKDEHYWYFTDAGFVGWMAGCGFRLVEKNRMEEDCGREDIGTYVFLREREADGRD